MRAHNCNGDTAMPQPGGRTKAPMRQPIRNTRVSIYRVHTGYISSHSRQRKKGEKNQEPKNSGLGLFFFQIASGKWQGGCRQKKWPEPAYPPRVSEPMKIRKIPYAQPFLLGRRDIVYGKKGCAGSLRYGSPQYSILPSCRKLGEILSLQHKT